MLLRIPGDQIVMFSVTCKQMRAILRKNNASIALLLRQIRCFRLSAFLEGEEYDECDPPQEITPVRVIRIGKAVLLSGWTENVETHMDDGLME